MSTARQSNMAKIAANIEDEATLVDQSDTDLDIAASPETTEDRINAERLKQAELKTAMDIQRLEDQKSKATSSAIKEKLQAQIDAAKQRKDEEDKRIAEQNAAQKQAEKVRKAGFNVANTVANTASDIKGGIDTSVKKVQSTVSDVAGTLEQVSTPGSIMLPITLLILFFFLLLPVNGQTRAQWLWLSLTGNAKITGSVSGSGGSGGGTDEVPAAENPDVSIPSYDFTGVG